MNTAKTYSIVVYGTKYNVLLSVEQYSYDGSLAIQLTDDCGMPFAIITVCLGLPIAKNQAYVDTNNCPWAEEFLTSNGLAKEVVGHEATSGFCTYPLYAFDLDKINN